MERSARGRAKAAKGSMGTVLLAILLSGVVLAFLISTLVRVTGEDPSRGRGALPFAIRTEPAPREQVRLTRDWKIAVQVLNGCGIEGAAERVVSKLRREEFNVVEVGNAPTFDYREDIVILRRGDLSMAREVAQLLGAEDILIQRNGAEFVNVTVIVGRAHREEALATF